MLKISKKCATIRYILEGSLLIFFYLEFYADFVAVDPYHFTLNIPSNHLYTLPAVIDPTQLQQYCDCVVVGIAAVFLALKRKSVICYQRTSDIAKRIAHFRYQDPSLVLF